MPARHSAHKQLHPAHKYLGLKILLAVLVVGLAVGGWMMRGRFDTTPTPASSVTTSVNHAENEPEPQAVFDKKMYSLSDPASIWVVVNKQRPLSPLAYAPSDLVDVGGGQRLRKEAANALEKLIAAAFEQSLQINPLSGYRSYSRQQVVYQKEVDTYGQAVADTESAWPGHSEHQTGFAIDVGGGGCGIEDCFGNTPHGKWVAANAYKFGFIIRYPEGKQTVTGYRYEPWHIRYVGATLSNEMHNQQVLTLEEFFGL